jgi:2-aminoadipate transaminase
MQALFKSAIEQDVAFVPGDSFYAKDGPGSDGREGSRHMRLNFSNAAPERIREGIRRLAAAVKSQLAGAKIHSEQPIEA